MSIYLTHIAIKGLFGYRNISWDVHSDVNILGGDNGSGKSTMFHICHQLLGWGFITEPRYAHLVERVELSFDNGWRMIWDKQPFTKNTEREEGYSYQNVENNKVEKDGTFLVQRVIAYDSDGSVIDPSDIVKAIPTALVSSFEQNILESQTKGSEFQAEDRTYLDVLLTSCISKRNERISQIFYNYLSQAAEVNNDDAHHQLTITGKDAQYLKSFNEALMVFFGAEYDVKTGMEAKISMTSKKSGKLIKYQDLSLGEKEALLMIVVASNSYDEPVIFWLDEPDLGLHVDWQSSLVKTLRMLNPNIQLFISTHAPSMIEGNMDKVSEISEISTYKDE